MYVQGGPSREFLSLLWKHLGSLVVDDKKKCFAERGEEKKVCRLFEPNGDLNYLVPQINDLLPKNTGTRTIMAYYRAVGRVILYCIGQEMPIAAHIIVSPWPSYANV